MGTRLLARSLRFSLLTALGLLPLACSGSTEGGPKGASKALPTCSSPEVSADGNYVTCSEGYTYRTGNDRCVGTAGGSSGDAAALPPLTDRVDCTGDPSVCEAYQYGYCQREIPELPASRCLAGCGTDADCAAGGACRCAGSSVGTCSYDDCDSDDDCDAGYHCASTSEGCGNSRYACQTSRDTCFGQMDCLGGAGFQVCVLQEDGHRACGAGSVCGRPFLVEAVARLANVTARSDWTGDATERPALSHLTTSERAALAEHWTRMGQMEHASIAAFARFSLQLLSLGAPHDLVEACNQALADETAHTRLCFRLASAYAGRALGPGPLDISRSLEVVALTDIVDLVLAEGCFGETSAALEALASAQTASDPVIVAAYSRIAADEQRHAELAFRFLRWALQRAPHAVRERISLALAAELPTAAGTHEVVVPCLEALLAQGDKLGPSLERTDRRVLEG